MSMAGMNIKDPEVRELALKLAERRHTSMTDAVRQSLTEALERDKPSRDDMVERIMEIAARSAARPGRILTDEDMYDDDGLPIW